LKLLTQNFTGVLSVNENTNILKTSFNHIFINNIQFSILSLRFCIFVYFVLSKIIVLLWFMVFNATFNNISVISWRSVLLVEETGVPRENHWPVASHWNFIT